MRAALDGRWILLLEPRIRDELLEACAGRLAERSAP